MAIPDEQSYLRDMDGNDKLYKFIPLKFIVSMLDTNRLRVSNIMKWEDVYENFFLKQQFVFDGKPIDVDSVANSYFGMCWTLNEETDAMWRIYSKCGSSFENIDDVAIRVETTASKLLNALWGTIYNSPAIVGRVRYLDREVIDGHLSNLKHPDINDEIKASLFTKRSEFRHEQEARVIIGVDSSVLREKRDYFDIDFRPFQLFDNFLIDPRVTPRQEREIQEELLVRGVSEDCLRTSGLYTITRQTIEL